ncbi:MAG: hypothetical protein AAFX78_13205 [Cyanobacteria bacterium J06638_20]
MALATCGQGVTLTSCTLPKLEPNTPIFAARRAAKIGVLGFGARYETIYSVTLDLERSHYPPIQSEYVWTCSVGWITLPPTLQP